jgi:hypothetical protein
MHCLLPCVQAAEVLQLRMLDLLKASNSGLMQQQLHLPLQQQQQQQQQQQLEPYIPAALNGSLPDILTSLRQTQYELENALQRGTLQQQQEQQEQQQQQQQRIGPDRWFALWAGFSGTHRPDWGAGHGRGQVVAQEQLEDFSRALQLDQLRLLYEPR